MKKHLTLLLLVIALLPACKKTQAPVYTAAPVVDQTYIDDSSVIPAQQQEDIAAFELQEDENPFNAASLEYAQDEVAPEVTEAQATPDRNAQSSKYGFKNVYYDFDQHDVRRDQKAALEQNASIAKSLAAKNNTIVLEGHACDSAGSSEYNLMLSEKRAEGVANELASKGIDRKKIRTVGRGSEMRIVPSGDREQQAPNRRVEFYAYPANTQE